MNSKALFNRVIILEDFCLNLLGTLPPGYSAVKLRGGISNRTFTEPPRRTALGHKPAGETVEGHCVQTDQALSCLDAGD